MIDPKELRVGSHYYNDSYNEPIIGRVLSIYGRVSDPDDMFVSLIYDMPLDNDSDPYEGAMANDLLPIPLTPELLAEIGFEKRDDAYWERWGIGAFDIQRKDGSSYFDYNGEIRLEYLHELEALYYLIYGQDLIKE